MEIDLSKSNGCILAFSTSEGCILENSERNF